MRTAVTSYRGPATRCPGCCSPAGSAEPYCQCCGIWLAGPQAAEVRWIDGELGRVDAARTGLISRRAALLDELMMRRGGAAGGGDPGAGRTLRDKASAGQAGGQDGSGLDAARQASRGHGECGRAGGVPAPANSPAISSLVHEVTGRTAARLLLAAGVMLVVIAAIVFTVADWARVGPLGRCAILLGVTALVLAAPRLLVRRNLHATAESAAASGLALTLADAY